MCPGRRSLPPVAVAGRSSPAQFGVYLFFVLSGASLAYTYGERIAAGHDFALGRFLWVRYVRLAPLYLALMVVVLPWKLLKDGASAELGLRYVLNATLLFGFYNPSVNAVLVGGWSLGIETPRPTTRHRLLRLISWAGAC